MKRKTLLNRITSAILSSVMVLSTAFGPLPGGIFAREAKAAEGFYTVSASQLKQGVNILPEALAKNKAFLNNYVRTDGKSMSLNSSFVTVSTNDVSNAGSHLSRAKMGREKNGNGQWGAQFEMELPKALVSRNYEMVMEARVKADYHKNALYNYYKHWDLGYVDLYGHQILKAEKTKDDEWQDMSATLSCDRFGWNPYLTFKVGHEPGAGCECGSSAVTGTTVYMYKKSLPYVSGAYIAANADGTGRISGGMSFGNKSSLKAYVVLEFSEGIRFSDNQGEVLSLDLDAYYTKNGQGVDKSIVRATLKSMTSQKMIFEFSVPNQIGGTKTDIYISGISRQQSFINDTFDLYIYDKDGNKFECGGQTVNSYITDFVGNPIDWGSSQIGLGNIYFDNVNPIMTNIGMSGSMINNQSTGTMEGWDDGKDRSAVFAGVGDWVSFEMSFDENVTGFDVSKVNAILSISNQNGNTAETIKLAASSNRGKTIYFNKLAITESMKQAGTRIIITGFEGLENVTDSYGNPLVKGSSYSADLKSVSMAPAQGIYLDVDAPIVATESDLIVSNGVYTPYATAEGEYFTFPLIISEDVSNTDIGSTSQINTLPAEFYIAMAGEKKAYSWYIDTNKTIDKDAKWNHANTGAAEGDASVNTYYPVNGQPFYLHVKLDKDIDYNYVTSLATHGGIYFEGTIHVAAKDHAGNKSLVAFPVRHQVDVTGPLGTMSEKADLKVDYTTLKASLNTSFSVSDDYAVKSITYYWTDTSNSSNPVTKTPVTITSDVADGLVREYESGNIVYEFTFDADSDAGRKGSAKLNVAVEDFAGKSYEMESKEFSYDFTQPVPVNTITTGTAKKPLLAPEVSIFEPTPKGSDAGTANTRTVLFIKTGVNEDGTNTYWGYDPRVSGGYSGSSFDVNYTEDDIIYDIMKYQSNDSSTALTAPGFWFKVTGEIDTANRTGEFAASVSGEAGTDDYAIADTTEYQEFQNIIKNTYGTLEFIFVTSQDFNTTRPGNYLVESDYNFNAATSQVQTHIVYLGNNAAYQVASGAVKDAQGQDAEDKLFYDAGEVPAVNLDNVAITINLKNVTAGEDVMQYDLAQLNKEQSKIELHYFGKDFDGSDSYNSGTVIHTWPMVSAHEQTVVIPSGVTKEIGWYGIWVTTCNANGTLTHTKLDKFFFMDPVVIDLNIEQYEKSYRYERIENAGTDYEKSNSQTMKVRSDNHLSEDADGVIELALGTAPNEFWAVDTQLTFSRTERTYEELGYGITDFARVRVYNKADVNYEENALWMDAFTDEEEILDFSYVPVCVEEITKESYGTAEAPKLPLYKGDNIICLELLNTNGVLSAKEELIYVSMPYEGVNFQQNQVKVSERTGGLMEVEIAPQLPASVEPVIERYFGYNEEVLADGENSLFGSIPSPYAYKNFKTSHIYDDDIAGEFWVLDQNGNLYAEYIEVKNIDGNAPDVATDNNSYDYNSAEPVFNFILNIQDYDGWVNADEIMLTFDKDYSAVLLGLTGEARTNNEIQVSMPIPINRDKDAEGNYLPWESYETSNNGIFRTLLNKETESEAGEEESGGFVNLEIWGVWKYDAEVDSGEREYPEDRTLTFTAMDANGNIGTTSRVYVYGNSGYSLSTGIAVDSGGFDWYQPFYEDGTLGIYSMAPFSKIHSYGAGTQKEAYYEWAGMTVYYTSAPMIQQDGLYTFQVTDLFGDNYDIELDVYQFGDIGIEVDFSETESTNQDVAVYANAALEGDFIKTIYGTTESGKTISGTIDEKNPRNAEITMPDNGTVTIETNRGNTRTVPVLNIDRVLEPANVIFYEADGDLILDDQTRDDVVTALVKCDEMLFGTNGTLSIEFPRGSKKGTTHTFEYQDAAGNTGTITAVLPCDISTVPGAETDEAAPRITASIFGMRSEEYQLIADAPNPDAADISNPANVYKAQKYRIVLTVFDDSETKIVVKNPGEAAPTDFDDVVSTSSAEHVELKANVITISENTAFDLYVIDKNNNVTAVNGINITGITTMGIEYYVDYQPGTDEDGHVIVMATFLPVNPEDEMTPINPLDKTLKTRPLLTSKENPDYDPEDIYSDEEPYLYADRYYYVFEDNGAYTFRYRDEVGNLSTVLAQVQSMSTAAAVVESVLWYGTDGNVEPDKSTEVNKDVTADLSMSKAVSEVTMYRYDAEAENGFGEEILTNAPVTISTTGQSIYVTYTDNVDYQIAIQFRAATSGRTGYYVLPKVTCIDKTAPVVTLESAVPTANNRSMKLTFTTDEDTLLPEEYHVGYTKNHSWMVTGNQPKDLQFTDKAGNLAIYQVTENAGLDVTYLEVVYSTDGTDAGSTTDAVNGMQLEVGADFYIKTNKSAAIKLNNLEQGTAQANAWTKLTLPDEAGVHILRLIDNNTGEILYDNVAAQPKDRIAPEVKLASNSVVLLEGTSVDMMLQKIHEGITITDDMDGEITAYTVDGYPDAANAGLYTLTYRAQDAAGNRTNAYRTLYIMKAGTPLLYVNGEAALPYGTVILSEKDVNLETTGMDTEAGTLVIKWREGMRTTAQMKHSTTMVENMQFTVPESGFYTVYVRTQDRTEYVTYLYVEE